MVKIKDFPGASYRGLMIDLARQWHDVKTRLSLLIDDNRQDSLLMGYNFSEPGS